MYFTPGKENNLLNNVRNIVKKTIPELNTEQIIMNGTHTHTGPFYGSDKGSERIYGIELDVMSPSDVQQFISEKIANAIKEAWNNRKTGGAVHTFLVQLSGSGTYVPPYRSVTGGSYGAEPAILL